MLVVVANSNGKSMSPTAEKKCIQTVISDSGTGMSEEHLNKIYDPFFTTKEVGKGTGLGLPISQAIIAEHNATIAVNSRINRGTTFTLIFPIVSELNPNVPS